MKISIFYKNLIILTPYCVVLLALLGCNSWGESGRCRHRNVIQLPVPIIQCATDLKAALDEWVGRDLEIQHCCWAPFGSSDPFIFHVQCFFLMAYIASTPETKIFYLVLQHYFSFPLFEEDNWKCSCFKWWLKIQQILNTALKEVKLKFCLWTRMQHY